MSLRIPSGSASYGSSHQPAYYVNQDRNALSSIPPMGPNPQHYSIQDPNMYSYARDGPAQNGGGSGWNNVDGLRDPQAGPSRSTGPYQPYAQSAPITHSYEPPPPRQSGLSGAGWTSMHPSVSPMPPPRADTPGRGVCVKLEDFVSHDRSRLPHGKAAPIGPGGLTSVPLNVSQPKDHNKAAASGMSTDGLGGGQPSGPSEFIKKLYRMLEEEGTLFGRGKGPGQPRGEGAKRGSVGWARGGSSFVVWDMNDFMTKVL